MLKILLTGASGYLGSTLLPYLCRLGQVTAIDYYLPGIPLFAECIFRQGDISVTSDVTEIMAGIDVVVHLAAIKGTDSCLNDVSKVIETNIIGTHNLIQHALKSNVKRFIFASTYWIYGDKTLPPYTENSDINPFESYGMTKALSEQELLSSGLDYGILRLSNIYGYGSGVNQDGVIHKFIVTALQGKPISVFGDGSQTLDFVHIDYVCRIISEMVLYRGKLNNIFNIGGGYPITISQLASNISGILSNEYKMEIPIINNPADNQTKQNMWLTIDKIRSILPYIKPVEISSGLASYIHILKEEKK